MYKRIEKLKNTRSTLPLDLPNKLRKGFSTVLVEGAAEIGTPILSDGNECGFLFSQSSGKGIAYLRYDKVSRDMYAGDAIVNLVEKISDFE